MVDQIGVHASHCCTYGCKYGDEDCPVATGQVKPQWQCEDCSCSHFFPNLLEDANEWWKTVDEETKRYIYRDRNPFC